MCSRRWRATTLACAELRSRAPTGNYTKDTLDRIAIPPDVLDRIEPTAILDHRLGRAAEPARSQSHRVRGGTEQPAPPDGFVVRVCRRPMLPLRGQFLERRRQSQKIWFSQLTGCWLTLIQARRAVATKGTTAGAKEKPVRPGCATSARTCKAPTTLKESPAACASTCRSVRKQPEELRG